ncbi:MAG: sulfatase-like hydrolase/transferase [Firmicutes bacterium]|nr:sulfatase-like hydrolase/transferase [Bacillota bacterium]
MPQQPNIFLIMTDEHAPQASEVYGHPYVKTPALRTLAESGVVFDAAYCNSPLCVPSRMAFMAGREVHRLETWDNGSPLSSGIPTIAHYLAQSGYDTVLSGKMHFKGPDQLHGFERRLVNDCCNPEINAPSWRQDRPGLGALRRLTDAGPKETAQSNRYDDQVEEQTLEYLRAYVSSSQDRPFALVTSFNAPHFPLTPRPEYFEHYIDIVTPPLSPPPTASPMHPVHTRIQRHFGLVDIPVELNLRARAAYFALVNQTDDRIGRLVEYTRSLPLKRPTVTIYTADHGEMMGEHGLWWKNNFYEESVRVPLIVSCADWFPPRREPMPVTLVDLARTLVAIGNPAVPDEMFDGMNLLPYRAGRQGNPLRPVTSEYHAHSTQHSMRMIRQGQYKLNYVVGEPTQLFDLHNDPHEWFDLSQDSRLQTVHNHLLTTLLQTWPENIEERVQFSQEQRQWIHQANRVLSTPIQYPWIPLSDGPG